MSSQLIIGETGEFITVSNIETLKSSIENYIKINNFNENDINIFDTKYNYINYYKNKKDLQFFNDNKYFLYHKKLSNVNIKNFNKFIEKIISPFNLNFQYNNNNNDFSINNLNEILQKIISKKKIDIEMFNIKISDLKSLIEKFDKKNKELENIYKNFKINSKISEIIKESYKNQIEGIDILSLELLKNCEKCRFNLNELKKKFIKINKEDSKILIDYEQSIKILKNTELQPELKKFLNKKGNNFNFLMDIYLNEDDMNKWKKNCIEKEKLLLNKINEKEKNFNFLNEAIKLHKNSEIQTFKNDVDFYVNNINNLFQEKNLEIINFMNNFKEEFNNFKKILHNITEINNSNFLIDNNFIGGNKIINEIAEMIEKFSDENFLNFTKLKISLENFFLFEKKMENSIEKFSKNINKIYNKFSSIKDNLNYNFNKIVEYNKTLDDLSKEFDYLKSPGKFKIVFENFLNEIKRRLTFDHKILNNLNKIQKLIEKENEFRNQFLKNENYKLITEYLRKCFKLEENEIKFSFQFNNNNETIDFENFLNDDDYDLIINEKDSTINSSLNNININNNNNDFKEIKEENNNLNQEINNLESALKIKINENENLLKKNENLKLDIENLNNAIDELSKDFLFKESNFENKINEFLKENDNLKKIISSYKGNNILNCPLCAESILNSKDYQNFNLYVKDLKEKLNNQIIISNLNEKYYKNLILQTNEIKKTFFDFYNVKINEKNNELNLFKKKFEIHNFFYEDLLSKEKENNLNFNKKNQDLLIQIKNLQENLNQKNNDLNKCNLLLENSKKNNFDLNVKINEISKNYNLQLNKSNEDLTIFQERINKNLNEINNLKLLIDKINNEKIILSNRLNLSENEKIIYIEKINLLENERLEFFEKMKIFGNEINEIMDKIKENENEKNIKEISQSNITALTNFATNVFEEVVYYKKIEKGTKCIFFQFQKLFFCMNFNEEIEIDNNNNNNNNNENLYFKIKYILDTNSLNDNIKQIINENNNLIIIGKVSKINEFVVDNNNNIYNLKEGEKFFLVSLEKIDFIVNFNQNELILKNFLIQNN